MKQVKGSYLVDFIKVLRANRDRNYDQWLRPEDWEIIDSKVFASQWYPLEFYRRAGEAIFQEIAKGNLEITRAFGKMIGINLTTLYQHMLVVGDPVATVEKYVVLRNIWFKDIKSTLQVQDRGPGRVTVKLTVVPEDEIKPEDAFAYLLCGNYDGIVEQTQVKNPRVEIVKVSDGYEFRVQWD